MVKFTFFGHATIEALFEPAKLAPISRDARYGALGFLMALVLDITLDGTSEKALQNRIKGDKLVCENKQTIK